MDDARIDNFGAAGDRLLLAWLGVRGVPDDFRRRGLGEGGVPKFGRLTAELKYSGMEDVTWLRTRVVGYVEYSLEGPGGRLAGKETCENAYHGEVTSDSRWLRAVTPPFNPFADRRTCCEFRFFDRLIEALARKGMAGDVDVRARVRGHVSMLINAPPCVSCIGVIRQFRLLFGEVEVAVSGGRHVPVSVYPAPPRARPPHECDDAADRLDATDIGAKADCVVAQGVVPEVLHVAKVASGDASGRASHDAKLLDRAVSLQALHSRLAASLSQAGALAESAAVA